MANPQKNCDGGAGKTNAALPTKGFRTTVAAHDRGVWLDCPV